MSGGGILHNIIFFILAIGVLVTFHEFGHYWIARLLNVKVLRFSVGFGRPLISWRRKKGDDEIEYVIAALPLGGYVKMLDEREAPVEKSLRARAFNTQPVIKRIAIVAAGPLFNFILAIALYWIVFLNGVDGRRPLIDAPATESIAAKAGFSSQDEILSVGDTKVRTWQNFRMALINHGIDGGELAIQVEDSDMQLVTRTLSIGDRHILASQDDVPEQLGFKPWQPDFPAVIGGVTETGAAKKAGLQKDDRVMDIDDRPVENWMDLVAIVEAHPEKTLNFTVLRNGETLSVKVTPGVRQKDGKPSGVIGAYQYVPEEYLNKIKVHVDYSPLQALSQAVIKTWDMSSLTLRVLGKMFTGEAALENISGPITIASYAGITASIGIITYLGFLAIISVSLGVLNLLPVPMLDGGHLFYYLIEIVKGSPVSQRFEEVAQQLGMLLLMMLMGLAIFNDIQRLVN